MHPGDIARHNAPRGDEANALRSMHVGPPPDGRDTQPAGAS